MPRVPGKRQSACLLSMRKLKNGNRHLAKGLFDMKPIISKNNKIGFIGIGYMGRPIAQRLLEAGFELTAYDRDHSKVETLVPYGAKVANSVGELSTSSNVVMSCLPSDEAVLSIFGEPSNAFADARPDLLVID